MYYNHNRLTKLKNEIFGERAGDKVDILNMFLEMDFLTVLVFILGLTFVYLEAFMPGFGISGGIGSFLLLYGIIRTADTLEEFVVLLVLLAIIIAVAIKMILKSFKTGKLAKQMVLSDELNAASGFNGTADFTPYLNRTGISRTVLRPAGIGEFDGERLNVVSDSEYIPAGTNIKIIKVEGSRVVVVAQE